jgi:hypothetical protein
VPHLKKIRSNNPPGYLNRQGSGEPAQRFRKRSRLRRVCKMHSTLVARVRAARLYRSSRDMRLGSKTLCGIDLRLSNATRLRWPLENAGPRRPLVVFTQADPRQ